MSLEDQVGSHNCDKESVFVKSLTGLDLTRPLQLERWNTIHTSSIQVLIKMSNKTTKYQPSEAILNVISFQSCCRCIPANSLGKCCMSLTCVQQSTRLGTKIRLKYRDPKSCISTSGMPNGYSIIS